MKICERRHIKRKKGKILRFIRRGVVLKVDGLAYNSTLKEMGMNHDIRFFLFM
jgi:hypothetical protein